MTAMRITKKVNCSIVAVWSISTMYEINELQAKVSFFSILPFFLISYLPSFFISLPPSLIYYQISTKPLIDQGNKFWQQFRPTTYSSNSLSNAVKIFLALKMHFSLKSSGKK